MDRPSIRDVLEALASERLVSRGFQIEAKEALERYARERAPAPWFVRALAGFGAWVAAGLLLAFLLAAEIVESEDDALGTGLVLLLVAVVLNRLGGETAFLAQLGLALSLLGQGLTIGGAGVILDSVAGGAAVALIVQVVLLVLHADSTHRFLSSLFAGIALAVLLQEVSLSFALDIALIVLLVTATWLWMKQPKLFQGAASQFHAPVGYGLTVSVFVVLLTSVEEFPDWPTVTWLGGSALSVGGFVVALAIVREVAGELRFRTIFGLGLMVTLIALSSLRAPGLPAAMIFMAIGFHRRDRFLLGIAAMFLLLFGSAFYYHLDLTLLTKAGVLVGSGLVLLGLRFYLTRFRWST